MKKKYKINLSLFFKAKKNVKLGQRVFSGKHVGFKHGKIFYVGLALQSAEKGDVFEVSVPVAHNQRKLYEKEN